VLAPDLRYRLPSFLGERLSKMMVVGRATLSTVWVIPMLLSIYTQFRAYGVLSETLTPDKLAELGGLVTLVGSESLVNIEVFAIAMVGAHGVAFLVSLWFLNHPRRNQSLVSA